MLKNFTIYVEKKEKFAVEAKQLQSDFNEFLGLKNIFKVRIFNCYIVQSITKAVKNKASWIVFGEKPLDMIYENKLPPLENYYVFGITYLPGQYDQRADSAAQCLHILEPERIYDVKYIKIIALMVNALSETDIVKIKKYCINPTDSMEYQLDYFYSDSELFSFAENKSDEKSDYFTPGNTQLKNNGNGLPSFVRFIGVTDESLMKIKQEYGLAMDLDDLIICRDYFANTEKRNPTETEIKVIDTYWSDHCRHKTFNTHLDDIRIKKNNEMPFAEKTIEHAFEHYLSMRNEVYGTNSLKPITLMDIATINAKYAKKRGWLNLEESEEVNAASIYADGVNGFTNEPWIIQFKNETHNHPTEIEPFGGAATCLGGAIRDPLSGRTALYQAMRITGSSDPREPIEKTLLGKLPQRKITTRASDGFSSYGNQIGLATGYVKEYYHPGFKAKRMEIGAVIGAALKTNVFRDTPVKGDAIILLGGKTGRDGCGGATGSSKEHTESSIHNASAEVQKGNAPEERKLMRLFRNPNAAKLIKKCNDFGAGGVCVAIGELAKGIEIILDTIPKKYAGLNATELAISESQERMAVVVDSNHVKKFIDYAHEENCEATVVAYVTNTNRLVMNYKDIDVVSIDRTFFDTNGAVKHAKVTIECPVSNFCGELYSSRSKDKVEKSFKESMADMLSSLECSSQQGLAEKFDSTVGAYSVLMPFGGKYQLTKTEGMVAVLPCEKSHSSTVTIMTSGYDPYLSSWSPFHGGVYSIVEVLSKITALGGNVEKTYLTLQEYFPAPKNNEKSWGNVFQALLGAFYAQLNFKVSAIGGKDSMSGTYNELEVPPVLAAFGVCVGNVNTIISHEFKFTDSLIIATACKITNDGLPDFSELIDTWKGVYKAIADKKIFSAYAVKSGGIAEALFQMSIGNKIGVEIESSFEKDMFKYGYGILVAEVEFLSSDALPFCFDILGKTINKPLFKYKNEEIGIDQLLEYYQKPLENVFPTACDASDVLLQKKYLDLLYSNKSNTNETNSRSNIKTKNTDFVNHANYRKLKPKVIITVFPGTNCEYETERAFEKAGAEVEVIVCKNLSIKDIYNSIDLFAKTIKKSQILMIPGGFSAGDEPEGAGKFIASFFRNGYMTDAVRFLLEKDGLILGICNGFQALVKLGLLPYGDICEIKESSPILTYNKIGRHVSRFVDTKIITNASPWLAGVAVGDIHTLPLSHGEGRFVASEELLIRLAEDNNIAAVYVDNNGNITKEMPYNPNGSDGAIEALISCNGRILGKMAHSERFGLDTYKNITGNFDQKLFKSGVDYFK